MSNSSAAHNQDSANSATRWALLFERATQAWCSYAISSTPFHLNVPGGYASACVGGWNAAHISTTRAKPTPRTRLRWRTGRKSRPDNPPVLSRIVELGNAGIAKLTVNETLNELASAVRIRRAQPLFYLNGPGPALTSSAPWAGQRGRYGYQKSPNRLRRIGGAQVVA
jgi:hypothetical protein